MKKKIKIKIKISACFGQFLILSWTEKGHEPSQAENLSARAMGPASSAQTHHYYILWLKYKWFYLPLGNTISWGS